MENNQGILELNAPVVLYVNNSKESNLAKKLLADVGIKPFLTRGSVEPLERKPLVIYCGGIYQGIDSITGLVKLLQYWRENGLGESLFKIA